MKEIANLIRFLYLLCERTDLLNQSQKKCTLVKQLASRTTRPGTAVWSEGSKILLPLWPQGHIICHILVPEEQVLVSPITCDNVAGEDNVSYVGFSSSNILRII